MSDFVQYIQKNWPEILVMGIGIPAIIWFFRKFVIKNKEESSPNTPIVNVYTNPKSDLDTKAKEKKIDEVRGHVSILFIDDETKFKVVTILKQGGWIQTKIVKDLKSLNDQVLLNAHIVFVDIQGVGKILRFPDEGLGLSASIKKKYPQKKLIIYSADSEGSRFHDAFRLADDQLSKNAVPYEFETIIETMTLQLISDGIL